MYSVTGTSTNNCSSTASLSINVNPLPTLTVTSSNSLICVGTSATLTATGANSYSWSNTQNNSSIIISPATTSSFTVNGTGQNGCVGTAVITQSTDLCTGILPVNNEEVVMSVFPNPNTGNFTVHVNTNEKSLALEVYNTLGQIILNQVLLSEDTLISIENYANGIYYIRLLGSAKPAMFKVIKQ